MIGSKMIQSPKGFFEIQAFQDLRRGGVESITIDISDETITSVIWDLALEFKDDANFTISSDSTKFNTEINTQGTSANWLFQILKKINSIFLSEIISITDGIIWEKHLSYMIATMMAETDAKIKFNPGSIEGGISPNDTDLKKIYDKLNKKKFNKGGTLTLHVLDSYNPRIVSNDWFIFRGRGLTGLSWKYNYRRFERALNDITNKDLEYNWTNFYLTNPGKDYRKSETDYELLVAEPDDIYARKANDLIPAVYIMVIGMRDGIFTGKKLSEYLDLYNNDWVQARRVVNGLDRATTISNWAQSIYKVIRSYSPITDQKLSQYSR